MGYEWCLTPPARIPDRRPSLIFGDGRRIESGVILNSSWNSRILAKYLHTDSLLLFLRASAARRALRIRNPAPGTGASLEINELGQNKWVPDKAITRTGGGRKRRASDAAFNFWKWKRRKKTGKRAARERRVTMTTARNADSATDEDSIQNITSEVFFYDAFLRE